MLEYTVKVYDYGGRYWYLKGKLHREDGPAVERHNGGKSWYLNGKRHREDGPAIEYANGGKSWHLNGKYLTEAEFNKRMNNTCSGKIVEMEGVKYKLVEV
jgi:hypothetical protein